ncbi:MAG: phosphoglycerate kinase [Bacteroidetes bacterium]|nr:phosphoglycerate kinase [Bacteroidota bacterium]
MITVDNFNFNNEKALVRVDFNVPLDAEFNITDDSRISAAIPTIKKILADGGSCILMSHLGRPKEGPTDNYSLKHIVNRVAELTGAKVYFANDCIGQEAKDLSANLKAYEILLIENLRFYKEEEKGDIDFAEKLSHLGTFYVNDAFGTAHRAHASTAVIAQFFSAKKCFGYIMAHEIANAQKVLNNPSRPFTAIVGGAKVSDKLLIIENLMDLADNIIIGGGMAYTFAKALGGKIGNSLCEDDRMPLALELIEKAKAKCVNLLLPQDSKVAYKFDNAAHTAIENNEAITDGFMGLDIGPKATEVFCKVISESKSVLWNGPMGVFEMSNFEAGTKAVAYAVADITSKGGFSLIGGGDSAAAIHKFNLADKVSYVSTGGGALLEYFEGKELPGIKAITG